MLDEILENNKKFVEEFEGEKLSHHPQKKLAILTCMDCRLTGFLEPALGIGRGDAKIIKNAGNNIVDEDAIRSIAAAIFNLGAEEVMVIGGASIYKLFLPYAEVLYLTEIDEESAADVYFPDFDKKDFTKTFIEEHVDDNKKYKFVTYVRLK